VVTGVPLHIHRSEEDEISMYAMRIVLVLVFLNVPFVSAMSGQPAKQAIAAIEGDRLMSSVRSKEAYVEAVTRGEGFMPWQSRESVSAGEREFRAWIESRKDTMRAKAVEVTHPCMVTPEMIARIKRNIEVSDAARRWYDGMKTLADEIAALDTASINAMIPELTPMSSYSFVCPNCFGKKTFEGGSEGGILGWNWRKPDEIHCTQCGFTYPDTAHPETAKLELPRTGQTLTFYLNADERANPDDRTGALSYKWARHPIHPGFDGIIRLRKASFALGAAHSLAMVYGVTGESRYAEAAARLLLKFARHFRHDWVYHDYWDGFADCDALYAAWHDKSLPIEWKRHIVTSIYKDDSLDKASMLQNYWGAGRYVPSTGAVSTVHSVCESYDLIHGAKRADGTAVLSDDDRERIEKDLILEWVMEAEPYIGGPGKYTSHNNKSPRIYTSMAAAGKVLGIPDYVHVALKGYEAVRDNSFGFDGFSSESPSYTNMYLSGLLDVPETLHGFTWPEGWNGQRGTLNLFRDDPMLPLMLRAILDIRRPDGHHPTLSDTRQRSHDDPVASEIHEIGMEHYPQWYDQPVRAIYQAANAHPTALAYTKIDLSRFNEPAGGFKPPEWYFPYWMTAIMRHGSGTDGSMLVLPFNPPGGHRHNDNLALSYIDRGDQVLGDHGYLSASPAQSWIHGTHSHNLVIVDDKEQSGHNRVPRLHMMVTTPHFSVVEASSKAYTQCSDYRRTVVMMKGPDGSTFAVDIFRVKGGKEHDWRLFSELAANDAVDNGISFTGIDMPPDQVVPDFGASMEREHVWGLRDTHTASGATPWQAVWKDSARAYRLWMLTPSDSVRSSNGPGQELWDEPGRRVRYVDATNTGDDLSSTFVAVHEPGVPGGNMPISSAVLIETPTEAGEDAVAVLIESDWGTYVVLSHFDTEAECEGVRFQGEFGVLWIRPDGKRTILSHRAATFTVTASGHPTGSLGFSDAPVVWESEVVANTGLEITAKTAPPEGWTHTSGGYLLADAEGLATGFPVSSVDGVNITIERFPVPKSVKQFSFPAVRLIEE
jgi:hypothetical protein